MNKITTNLWFDKEAEEAARFYTSIFSNSALGAISYYGKEGQDIHGQPEGKVMTVEFDVEGQRFVALNGGPHFKFNESVSFIIDCDTQDEVDYYWDKLLSDGGQEQMCGWLKDKYGLSWQVVPVILNDMIKHPDKVKSGRAIDVMLKMKKLDIAALQKAFKG